jgi:hypothetical protein
MFTQSETIMTADPARTPRDAGTMSLSPPSLLHANQYKTIKKIPDPKLKRMVKTHEKMGWSDFTAYVEARDSNIVATPRAGNGITKEKRKRSIPMAVIMNSGR